MCIDCCSICSHLSPLQHSGGLEDKHFSSGHTAAVAVELCVPQDIPQSLTWQLSSKDLGFPPFPPNSHSTLEKKVQAEGSKIGPQSQNVYVCRGMGVSTRKCGLLTPEWAGPLDSVWWLRKRHFLAVDKDLVCMASYISIPAFLCSLMVDLHVAVCMSLCPQRGGPSVGLLLRSFCLAILATWSYSWGTSRHQVPKTSPVSLCHPPKETGLTLASLILLAKRSCKVKFP